MPHDDPTIGQEDMELLIAPRKGFCASIYLPMRSASSEAEKNRIRLKNLIAETRKQFQDLGVPKEEVRRVLEPAEEVARDGAAPRHDRPGLAILLAQDLAFTRRLPGEVPPLAVACEGRFHLKPLLRFRRTRDTFFVLSLSQNHVRLFEGTRHAFVERTEVDLPESLAEALWLDDPESGLQQHVTRKVTAGSRLPLMFSGASGRSELEKEHLLRYFRRIDESLAPWLMARGAPRPPLVLACVEYYLPIYAEANTYGNLARQTVPGNPDHVDRAALHDRAWRLVEGGFDGKEEDARALFRRREGDPGAASTDLKEILSAAHGDRVDTLFVSEEDHAWGRLVARDGRLEVTRHEAHAPGAVDLLDVAATETLRRGGRVFVEKRDGMPADTQVAALFRF